MYKQDKSSMIYYACSKDLKRLKYEFEWLKEVDSISIQSSLNNVVLNIPQHFQNNLRKTIFYRGQTKVT